MTAVAISVRCHRHPRRQLLRVEVATSGGDYVPRADRRQIRDDGNHGRPCPVPGCAVNPYISEEKLIRILAAVTQEELNRTWRIGYDWAQELVSDKVLAQIETFPPAVVARYLDQFEAKLLPRVTTDGKSH